MSAFTLISQESQMMMIDFQEKLLPAINKNEEITQNVKKLLKSAAVLDIPVKYSEQYPKGLGKTTSEIAKLLPEDSKYFSKLHFSCMAEHGFESFIDSNERKQIIVFGIESHICVFSTVMGMLEKGMNVAVVSDACGSRKQANHEIAMDSLGKAGAIVVPTETVIYQLISESGTPEFKELLPLFKQE